VEPATWLIGDALVRVQIFVYAPLRGDGILSSPPRPVLKLDIFVVDLAQSQATPFAPAFAAAANQTDVSTKNPHDLTAVCRTG
jgi:hypothetical protein